MHHIYTSESIVLRRKPQDSSAYYYILTKDLGLIQARAQGVRSAHSRLKGALQEFSLSTIAYVHGKGGWKITTAIPDKNFYFVAETISDPLSFKRIQLVMSKISDCLIRMIPGEEKSTEIFMVIKSGFDALVSMYTSTQSIELIILIRVLFVLGLVVNDEITKPLLEGTDVFTEELYSYVETHKKSLISVVNNGFKESQL